MATTAQKSKKNSTTSAPKTKNTKGVIMPEQESNARSEQAFEQPAEQASKPAVRQSNPTLLASSDAVFTMEQIDAFDKACHIIDEAQSKSEGLAEAIAAQLYRIDAAELYKIKGYTSMKAFAGERFGISAGTCSDSINTYKRFGKLQGEDGIHDKYKEYRFSTLMLIKKLSDDDIERAGIKPTMGRSDIKLALEHLKELQLEDKHKKALIERINLLTDNVILHISAEEFAAELCEKFGEKIRSIMLMSVEEIQEVMAYIENRLRELDPDNSNLTSQEEESSTAEPEEQEEDSSTAEQEETHTMPTKTMNIKDVPKDELLTAIEALIDGVYAGEYDIHITCLA